MWCWNFNAYIRKGYKWWITGLKTANQKQQTKIENLNKTIERQNICIIIFFSIAVVYILWPKKDIENEISNLKAEYNILKTNFNDRISNLTNIYNSEISNLKEE